MKKYDWDPKKNNRNKVLRGMGFEDVVEAIGRGAAWIEDNTSRRHVGQSVFVLRQGGKTWVVPFQETEDRIRLITIFERKRAS